jgi:hypothetical protein
VGWFTGEGETQRAVDDLNIDLHTFERKRVLREPHSLVDVTVPASQNYVVLGVGELPTQLTAAVGAVTTLGTVVAFHAGTFGTHSLDEVAGTNALNPKNLMAIFDGATRDPILSGDRTVYGLLQSEVVTDGHTINTTTQEVQISFVRITAAGNDLEAVPFADIENAVINYCTRERVGISDLNEEDFLKGAIADTPAGVSVTRQTAYDGQGATPVDLTTVAILDLEGPGLAWRVRDDLEATLFEIVEGSAGGTSQINIGADVDELDIDAVVVNLASGATINSGGTRPIAVGVNDGLVESTAGDLEVKATGELVLNDANLVAEGTWAGPGVKLSDTTAEVTAYETAFGGEVSLFDAVVQAYNNSARTAKTYANVTSTESADTDIGGVAGGANLDAQLPDMSLGTFLTDYDVFLNGELLRPGADASANNDYYPGTSLANGQLRFEFTIKNNDVIAVIAYA